MSRNEKIMHLLDDAINEVFFQMQEELGIENGDVSPMDAIELESRQKNLADIIGAILQRQMSL